MPKKIRNAKVADLPAKSRHHVDAREADAIRGGKSDADESLDSKKIKTGGGSLGTGIGTTKS